MKEVLPSTDNGKIRTRYSWNNVLFFFITIACVVLLALLVASLSTEDSTPDHFQDHIWTQSACATVSNPAKHHPCYILGSDGECPLDLTPYETYTYRGIDYHILTPTASYRQNFEYEVDLLLGCHSVNFTNLLVQHGQPHILLLNEYVAAKWAHYSSGWGDCATDKRIVFPTQHRLSQHHGVLIHEFAHYFQDIIWNWDQTSQCDNALFSTIVPGQYGNHSHGDGIGWPYCYGLSDGSRGVPNSIELMAIITEGACVESPSGAAGYDRVCGPSSEYLKDTSNPAALNQYLCMEELYGQHVML